MGTGTGTGMLKVAGLLLVFFIVHGSSIHLMIDNSYMVDYEINSTWIEFKVSAFNVTGWVGIGLNEKNQNMVGADLFIGGYNPNATADKEYGGCYVGEANARPKECNSSISSTWKLVKAEEINNTNTVLTVGRKINDTGNPLLIKNAPIYLLWSFEASNDNVSASKHTKRGSCSVNFLANGAGTCKDQNSGAKILSVGICTLIMGVVAAVSKI